MKKSPLYPRKQTFSEAAEIVSYVPKARKEGLAPTRERATHQRAGVRHGALCDRNRTSSYQSIESYGPLISQVVLRGMSIEV